jgi:hypothetical protein
MSKRHDSDCEPSQWTRDQVCCWLVKIFDEGQLGVLNEVEKTDITQQFIENGIDGKALQILPDEEQEFRLLIKKSGPRMKLKTIIHNLFCDTSSQKLQKISQDEKSTVTSVYCEDQSKAHGSTVFQTKLAKLLSEMCIQDGAINTIATSASEIIFVLKPNLAMQSSISELEKLVKLQNENMSSTLVVVGDTGSGKSSLLNALLGESELLPTNGTGNACTGK